MYRGSDPTEGVRRYDISVGREQSPVMYLVLNEQDESRLEETSMSDICRLMEGIGQASTASYECSELDHGGRKTTFRFWWD